MTSRFFEANVNAVLAEYRRVYDKLPLGMTPPDKSRAATAIVNMALTATLDGQREGKAVNVSVQNGSETDLEKVRAILQREFERQTILLKGSAT